MHYARYTVLINNCADLHVRQRFLQHANDRPAVAPLVFAGAEENKGATLAESFHQPGYPPLWIGKFDALFSILETVMQISQLWHMDIALRKSLLKRRFVKCRIPS